MPDNNRQTQLEQYRRLALTEPGITVLSDHALSPDQSEIDSFNLTYHMGPVFDILRHPKTKTPFSVAIYGGWGSGKTSAMKWLDHLIGIWNDEGKCKDKIGIRKVWFYPWKYHSKEDVWRGLISEVIISSIDVKDANLETVGEAVKRFGGFLGRSFMHVAAGLTFKAGIPGNAASAELKLASLKDILEDYNQVNHPERGYLNEFETSLRDWIGTRLGANERMVIFIDDLDRCMPDIALEVLEALKLYLGIEGLIFVVGVDRTVIDSLVRKYYEDLGLKDEKSGQYLAKMFQVVVELSPHYRQISDFLDDQLKYVDYWQNDLSGEERDLFRNLIFKLADRNPREVKRLINDALMSATGCKMSTVESEYAYEFRQGLQIFFVRKLLSKRFPTHTRLIGDERGDEFFQTWSRIARRSTPEPITVPDSYVQKLREGSLTDMDRESMVKEFPDDGIGYIAFADEGLLDNRKFADMLVMLSDPDLNDLMQVEYPSRTVEIGLSVSTEDDALIRSAIASKLGKEDEDVNRLDFASVSSLRLPRVSDIRLLRDCSGLVELDITMSDVGDLSPISGLSRLLRLTLAGNPVSNLAPISKLKNLLYLDISHTDVSDLTPVHDLTSLEVLDISHAIMIKDLTPLYGLANLQRIHVFGVGFTDQQLYRLSKAISGLEILGK